MKVYLFSGQDPIVVPEGATVFFRCGQKVRHIEKDPSRVTITKEQFYEAVKGCSGSTGLTDPPKPLSVSVPELVAKLFPEQTGDG